VRLWRDVSQDSEATSQRRDRRFGRDERFRPRDFGLRTVERFLADALARDFPVRPFDLRVFEGRFLPADLVAFRGRDFFGRVFFAGFAAAFGRDTIRLTAAGTIGLPLAAALPAIAPSTPPTTAPTGPTTLPRTAPVAAPAASFEMVGSSIFSC
jgi:hypothetical protein